MVFKGSASEHKHPYGDLKAQNKRRTGFESFWTLNDVNPVFLQAFTVHFG